MLNPLICSSHTISGVMPGGPVASRHGFCARVAACAQAGYQGMCLHLRDYAEQRAAGVSDATLRQILADHGMSWNSLEFLTGWEEGLAPLENTAWAAVQGLEIPLLNIGAGPKGAMGNAQTREAFAALCARAAAHDAMIALEVVPWSSVADLATARQIVGGIGNAGLVIDCWHMFRGGIALSDIAALDGGRILSVQINDADADPGPDLFADTFRRRLCGEGAFDLVGFLTAIRATGTAAPIGVEILSPELAAMQLQMAAEASMRGARALLAQM